VRGAGVTESNGTTSKEKSGGQFLSDDEILGNAFVFILAGHETTANSIHFSMLELAMSPSTQRRLQASLDDIFGSRPVDDWSYDTDLPKLFGSMTGAILNEELRLMPPVLHIPKMTTTTSPQSFTLNGKKVVLPANTYIGLSTIAAHRNPNFWPTVGPPKRAGKPNDLDDFIPERWLVDSSKTMPPPGDTSQESIHAQENESEEVGGPQGGDTSPSLFRPQRGAYIPFSEGYRACLGRRFAQVEVVAVLAVIFSRYSVELDVGATASDEELHKMSKEERRSIWERTKNRTRNLIDTGCSSIITFQLRDGKVPIRLVPRGQEMFDYSD
jgi:cytochrome P450